MNERLISSNRQVREITTTIPSGQTETEAIPMGQKVIGVSAPTSYTHVLTYLEPVSGLEGTALKLHAGITPEVMQVLKDDGEDVVIEGGSKIPVEITFGIPYIKFVASQAQAATRTVKIVLAQFD